MCGIVGYVGKSNCLPILINGLKSLEYRGYDSAGIAFKNGRGIEMYKTEGRISDLQKIIPDPVPRAKTGFGHTRWATHGAPSSVNAHPHVSEGVYVVHNGIIENYRELKSELTQNGCMFSSDTDTEVIPQLILVYLREGLSLKEAIKKTISRLRGTFALGIMSDNEPDTLFAIKRGSPLVIGIGDGEYFFASDVPAILSHTRKCIFVEDNEMCILKQDGISLLNLDSDRAISIDERKVEINWTPDMAEKEGYDFFMLKEIFEQPEAVKNTIREWIENPQKLLGELGITKKIVKELRRLQIVACGTSYHAALFAAYIIQSLARIHVDVDIASEYRYKEHIVEKDTLFISITQSGETADTLAAQREAQKRGARALTICNVVGSTSAREADAVLYTRAGPEIGVASTKAFTSQMAALCLLALALGTCRGGLKTREAKSLRDNLAMIPSLLDETLKQNTLIEKLAKTLIHTKSSLYLGRGISYPIALEGALKMKEISYIHAEGYPAGEMKHGPIALVEQGLPVVVVCPKDNLCEKTFSNIEEVKARGGRIIAITNNPSYFRDKVDDLIEVPYTHPVFTPFVTVLPLQLLAYHAGVFRGCDVDKPRNLAKGVTVE